MQMFSYNPSFLPRIEDHITWRYDYVDSSSPEPSYGASPIWIKEPATQEQDNLETHVYAYGFSLELTNSTFFLHRIMNSAC